MRIYSILLEVHIDGTECTVVKALAWKQGVACYEIKRTTQHPRGGSHTAPLVHNAGHQQFSLQRLAATQLVAFLFGCFKLFARCASPGKHPWLQRCQIWDDAGQINSHILVSVMLLLAAPTCWRVVPIRRRVRHGCDFTQSTSVDKQSASHKCVLYDP